VLFDDLAGEYGLVPSDDLADRKLLGLCHE